jgi:hypothetical protein
MPPRKEGAGHNTGTTAPPRAIHRRGGLAMTGEIEDRPGPT